MERVILFLAMLAGLHLLLSFFRSAAQGLKGFLNRRPEATAAPEPVKVTSTHWQHYDRPAYQRRTGIDIDPAKSSEASFEVIA
ncbi:hypothetical protein [Accumulibacter sp.]|uniref:hypothetical protein n=1 Tax=Accumulibacter sp. TaxID=2053492 RepID=UPI001AC7BF93|nr:hypothetical protein [Accumulibacter sp.]MBN8514662.1 hypothetical protein [Accumulibacter sp.]MBO3703415.1 hypothetical protein [Accumulibacter sp.]